MSGAVPVTIFCPTCHVPHLDEGEWATRPHKTHQCQGCGHEWRPFPFATVGVAHPLAAPADGAGLREAVARVTEKLARVSDLGEQYPLVLPQSDARIILSALTGNPSLHVSENIGLLAQGLVPTARAGDVSGQTEAG